MSNSFELAGFQRTDSFCCKSPQTELLLALKRKSIDDFENLLLCNVQKNSIDVNYVYEDPDNKTLLDIACSSAGNCKFVDLLLKYGADVNLVNSFFKKPPLHFAVEYSDFETVRLLVEDTNVDVNAVDRNGNTALHVAAKCGNVTFVQLLLEHPAIDPNRVNRKSQTPLHSAITEGSKSVIAVLVNNSRVDLDTIKDFDDLTCREMISKKFPQFEMKAPPRSVPGANKDLFTFLRNRDIKTFLSSIKANRSSLEYDDGSYTYLQYSCRYGLLQVVRTLLDLGANPNNYCEKNQKTPVMIAAEMGYYEIVCILAETNTISFEPVNDQTVLHALLNGLLDCYNEPNRLVELGSSEEEQIGNYYKCLEYLLSNVSHQKLDLNYPDDKGNTALHYAVRLNDSKIIGMLLTSGAYVGFRNVMGDMPVKYINANIIKEVLDNSIVTNGKHSCETDYEIIYKYHLLAPLKVFDSSSKIAEYRPELGTSSDSKYEIVAETEPLVEMSTVPELRPLLKHPLLTAFLNLKWYMIRKWFYINVLFYVSFWFLLTIYVLFIYGPTTSQTSPTNTTIFDPNDYANFRSQSKFVWFLTFLLCGLLLLRELFQFAVSPLRYMINFENWIEILLIGTTFTILLCKVASNNIKSQIAAVAILLSWMELVLLIGRHPLLSTNIEMFKVVSCNFLKFLVWYSVLILAFAFSFYILFKDSSTSDNSSFFVDPIMSLFKSVIMLTGEFETGSIPFSEHPGTSHLLFVLFVFLIAIVLFNLLNGLAVSDTQAIKADAELVDNICRAKLITYIETMAISNPFSFFNVWDKISCMCCCVPIASRRSRFRREKSAHAFCNRINLFPYIFPDREVRTRPNEQNRVIFEPSRSKKIDEETTCIAQCAWRIDPAIMKATKLLLLEKSNGSDPSNQSDIAKCFQKLDEYKKKLDKIEEKISAMMALLRERL